MAERRHSRNAGSENPLELEPRPMRRGSLGVRFVKCGKPGCACAADREARHGPYYSLTRAVGKKTKSRFLSKAQAEIAKRQITKGGAFRKDLEAYWRAREALADEELNAVETGSSSAGSEKGGSAGRSSARSRRKSPS